MTWRISYEVTLNEEQYNTLLKITDLKDFTFTKDALQWILNVALDEAKKNESQ